MNQPTKKEIQMALTIKDKIRKYLLQEEYRNETGGKAFIDLKEERYVLNRHYNTLEVEYLDKKSDLKTNYTFSVDETWAEYPWFKYQDTEISNTTIFPFKNATTSILKNLDMLILHIDKYFEAQHYNKILKTTNTKNKLFKI